MGAAQYQYETPLNETQLFVLRTFTATKNAADREELTNLYINYIQQKLNTETNRLWNEGKLNDSVFEEMLNTHIRTPYNR
ncbi:MAG: hypothetical protein FWC39_03810 [Bacteroidetes bacterium]|nr:hypothetical protein [Bacteroidota bacterium]